MKMVSQSRAEKIAALYVAANTVAAVIGMDGDIDVKHVAIDDLMRSLADLDGGDPLSDPMQVLEGD